MAMTEPQPPDDEFELVKRLVHHQGTIQGDILDVLDDLQRRITRLEAADPTANAQLLTVTQHMLRLTDRVQVLADKIATHDDLLATLEPLVEAVDDSLRRLWATLPHPDDGDPLT